MAEKKRKTVGKPPINEPDDIEKIQRITDEYFEVIAEKEEKPTFAGYALALGYVDRRTLWENAKKDIPISSPLKKGMLRIEESYEKDLRSKHCTGAIFALKNRGWSDRTVEDEIFDKLNLLLASIEGEADKVVNETANNKAK